MVVQPSISGDIADGLSVVLTTLPSLYNSPQSAIIVQLEKGVLRRARAVRNHDFGGNLFCFVMLLLITIV
jgi:ribosomal protein S8